MGNQELKIIVRKNPLNVPENQVKRLESGLQNGDISFISPDREWPLFLMYTFGRSIAEISMETGIPNDIIVLTALHYDWINKASVVQQSQNSERVTEIQKDLVNTVLLATYASMKKELAEVIAGRKSADEVSIVPRDMQDLERLIKMVANVNNLTTPADKVAKGGGTIVQAQNVQINNNQSPTTDASESSETRIEKLKKLRENRASK